jgi:hypothetical protein
MDTFKIEELSYIRIFTLAVVPSAALRYWAKQNCGWTNGNDVTNTVQQSPLATILKGEERMWVKDHEVALMSLTQLK